MAYKLGDKEQGPLLCAGCNETRNEVTFLGRDAEDHAIWRCTLCMSELYEQMKAAQGVDTPAPEPVKSGKSARPRLANGQFAPKQGQIEEIRMTTPQVELTHGKTSEATFVLDKADVGGGIRTKGDRKAGVVYGSLYIPAELAGDSTEFKVTIEPVN